jgi:hypothetical protein
MAYPLFCALIAGAAGALFLIRAAHGRPAVTNLRQLPSSSAADQIEALTAARALRWGIASTLRCTALLVTAVAGTWYGPEREPPVLQIRLPLTPPASSTGR